MAKRILGRIAQLVSRSLRLRILSSMLFGGMCVSCSGASDGSEGMRGSTFPVLIDADGPATSIDPRLFGTNVPAWLGPELLGAEWFVESVERSGVTTLRMPGGSWSNTYDWSACELRTEGCFWPWAARPANFAALLDSTGLPGIWTVSINETAESAAALVAYFNGSVGDERAIGRDINGKDWGTVSDWAAVRASGGYEEPIGISMWEVGNEVYGGRPAAGGNECASFGWEEVWTCDGEAYMLGEDGHDGYVSIAAAMRAVDSSVTIGAVGVSPLDSWSDWGTEVIEHAGDAVDFYAIHRYGFDESPGVSEMMERSADGWAAALGALVGSVPSDMAVAVTEHNLVSFEGGDTDHSMTKAINALYLADTLGRLASGGVAIANHWNFANGTTESGTDYGLIDIDTQDPFPAFAAMSAWSEMGQQLLDAPEPDSIEGLSIYPTRTANGSLAVLVLNPHPAERTLPLEFVNAGGAAVSISSYFAATADATEMAHEPERRIGTTDDAVEVVLGPWSITSVRVTHG